MLWAPSLLEFFGLAVLGTWCDVNVISASQLPHPVVTLCMGHLWTLRKISSSQLEKQFERWMIQKPWLGDQLKKCVSYRMCICHCENDHMALSINRGKCHNNKGSHIISRSGKRQGTWGHVTDTFLFGQSCQKHLLHWLLGGTQCIARSRTVDANTPSEFSESRKKCPQPSPPKTNMSSSR